MLKEEKRLSQEDHSGQSIDKPILHLEEFIWQNLLILLEHMEEFQEQYYPMIQPNKSTRRMNWQSERLK